jgi:enoyl-CoA hydratase
LVPLFSKKNTFLSRATRRNTMDLRQHLAAGILEIVIDRPPVNAFSIGLLEELTATIQRAGDDAQVRTILIRAEGRGFCGGGDVKEVERLSGFEGILGQVRGSQGAALAILRCPVPVVLAIHGYCIGVGVLLAGAADMVVAAAGTRFVLAEIDNGATAGGVLAMRLMPEMRVRAAMMTADPVLAEELHGYGSVYCVTPPVELAQVARDVTARIAGKNAAALQRLKRSLNNSARVHELEAAYRAEVSYTYELNIMGVSSAGRTAFIDGDRASYMAAIAR